MGPSKSPRTRKRTYNTRLIKRDYPYFVTDIAELFHVHRNAVWRWIKAGLQTIDRRRPVLIHGNDLIDFLNARQMGRKRKCAIDEFYCCRCRRPRHALLNHVQVQFQAERRLNLSGKCENCGTRMNRAGSVAKIEIYRRTFIVQAPAEGRLSGRSDPVVMCDLEGDKVDA
jgi:hypothetical protein